MENRTVFDTNIWVSYVLGSKLYELTKFAFDNDILFLRSMPSVAELREVLSRKKFEKYNFDIEEIIDVYTDISEFCHTKPQFNGCADPKDNYLFDLALQGNANYLVSGDAKVLATPIKSKTLKIVTLKGFRDDFV